MLGCVSDFLRATLAHDGRHEHSLAEELALLDAYLEIEKARLGERLRLTMKAGPDLLDSVVPYLMLQPLVENAIRHGIAPLAAPGRLDIHLERAGTQLVVEVQNDGQQPAQRGSGIGLANVRDRLRHLYGDRQQVEAGWHPDGRFCVRIALPLRGVEAGELVSDHAEIESAPSCFFVLQLSNHKLFFVRETSHAPFLSTFEATVQAFLSNAYKVFIRDYYDQEKSEDSSFTWDSAFSMYPRPELKITPMATEGSLNHYVRKFQTINTVEIRLLNTNHELDNSPLFGDAREVKDKIGADEIVIRTQKNRGRGLK